MRTDSFHRTFIVSAGLGADLAKYTRVSLNGSGQLQTAGAATGAIGTLLRPGVRGESVAVHIWEPTREVIASGAIAEGANVEPDAATGKYKTAAGATKLVALEPASADGDVIEIAVVD